MVQGNRIALLDVRGEEAFSMRETGELAYKAQATLDLVKNYQHPPIENVLIISRIVSGTTIDDAVINSLLFGQSHGRIPIAKDAA